MFNKNDLLPISLIALAVLLFSCNDDIAKQKKQTKTCDPEISIPACRDGVVEGYHEVQIAKYCIDGKVREEVCMNDQQLKTQCKIGLGCYQTCESETQAHCLEDGRLATCVDGMLQIESCENGACFNGKCVESACAPASWKPICYDDNKIELCKEGRKITANCADFAVDGICKTLPTGLTACVAPENAPKCSPLNDRCSEDGNFRVLCDRTTGTLKTEGCSAGTKCKDVGMEPQCVRPCEQNGELSCRRASTQAEDGTTRVYAAMSECKDGEWVALENGASSTCKIESGKTVQYACAMRPNEEMQMLKTECAAGSECKDVDKNQSCVDPQTSDNGCRSRGSTRCANAATLETCIVPDDDRYEYRWTKTPCAQDFECHSYVSGGQIAAACLPKVTGDLCKDASKDGYVCDAKTPNLYQCIEDAGTKKLFATEVTASNFCAQDFKSIERCDENGQKVTVKKCASETCAYPSGKLAQPECTDACTEHRCEGGKVVLCENKDTGYKKTYTHRSQYCFENTLLTCNKEQTRPTQKPCAATEACAVMKDQSVCATKCSSPKDDTCIDYQMYMCYPQAAGSFLENTGRLCNGTCTKNGSYACIANQKYKCINGGWTEDPYTYETQCEGTCAEGEEQKHACKNGVVTQCLNTTLLWTNALDLPCAGSCEESELGNYKCQEEGLYECRKFAADYLWTKVETGNCIKSSTDVRITHMSCAGKQSGEPQKTICDYNQGCYNAADPTLSGCYKLCDKPGQQSCADAEITTSCVSGNAENPKESLVLPADKSISLTSKCEAGSECRMDNDTAVCAQTCTPDPQSPYECITLDNGKTVLRSCKEYGTQNYWEIYSNSYCDADLQMLVYCEKEGEPKTLPCSQDNASQCSSDKTQCLSPNCAFGNENTSCSGSNILTCQNTANYFGLSAVPCPNKTEQCEMAAPNQPVCVATCPDSEITTLGTCNENTLSACKNTGTSDAPVYSVVDTTCANGCAYFYKMATCIN